MSANLKNSEVAIGWEKVSFHSNPKEGQCKHHTITLISHVSKVILKILQARLQQYVNIWKIFKLDLEKSEEPEVKLPTPIGSQKKQENSKKNLLLPH